VLSKLLPREAHKPEMRIAVQTITQSFNNQSSIRNVPHSLRFNMGGKMNLRWDQLLNLRLHEATPA
jgi:hypothetical protein